MSSLVVMGVSGCGKSSLAQAVATALGLPLIEGDDHHDAENLRRMREGIALTDGDRQAWLARLAALLAARPQGAVLSCSALKRAYRDQLRAAAPGLRFAFLQISPALARQRVAARASTHFFPSGLVESQFAALQPPVGEAGVLTLDASLPLAELRPLVLDWLQPPVSAVPR